MRFPVALLICLFTTSGGFAQFWKQSKEDRQLFKSYFIAAEEYYYLEDYEEAVFHYQELLKMDPGNYNLNFLLGACYLSIHDKKLQAIPYLETAVQGIATGYREGSYRESNAPREAFFALARVYQINRQYDLAIDYYERYRNAMIKKNFADIEYVNKQIASCETAKKFIDTPVEVSFTPLGEKTEQTGSTYNAVISGMGNRLVYMNDRPFYRAILMTELKGGKWTKPRVINQEVWSDGYSYPTCLSFDGTELFLVNKKGMEADIYISYYKDGEWSRMTPLDEQINTDYYESHASISPNGKKLYFTSDRPGGRGGLDIYVSERLGKEIWGEPENLGARINSFYNEETPFISSDNRTLFFSSQGHTTMGGYDIFSSDFLPDGNWSVPGNLGYPLNTSDDDLFYVPRKNKNQGLYATIIPEKDNRQTIYSVTIGPDTKETQAVIKVREDELEEDIKIEDISAEVDPVDLPSEDTRRKAEETGQADQETIADQPATSDQKDQDAEAAMTDGSDQADESAGTDTAAQEEWVRPTAETINPEEEYYVLNSVFFDFDDDRLNEQAREEVDRIFEVMSRYPDLRLEVTGHTDAKGAADYNQRLSERRARSVVHYLVERGIDPDRLIARGVGESAPIALDYTAKGQENPEGMRLNRHVDFRLHNLDHPNVEVAEVFVPDHLRPKKDYSYSVLLLQSDSFLDTVPAVIKDEEVSLIITDRHYLYTAGNFKNRIDAVKLLNHAIDSGFPEARMYEKRQLEELVTGLIEGEVPPVITFTIQIMALEKPVAVTYFKDLDRVSKFKGSDGLTRYVYGEFDEIDKAFDELRRVRSQGYHDAFIMYLARYRKTGMNPE